MIAEGMEQVKREIPERPDRSPKKQPVYPQTEDVKYLRNKMDQFENHLSHLSA
jgi:hypothetical protein